MAGRCENENGTRRKWILLGASYGDALTLIENDVGGGRTGSATNIVLGYLDDRNDQGLLFGPGDLPVLGPIRAASRFGPPGIVFLNNVYGFASDRLRVASRLEAGGLPAPAVISPDAHMSDDDRIRMEKVRGVVISPGAVIGRNAVLGEYVAVRCNAVIGHDAVVGPYSFVVGSALARDATSEWRRRSFPTSSSQRE